MDSTYGMQLLIKTKKMSKVTVREDYLIEVKEVYEPIVLKTSEGVEYFICMRDSGIEITEDSIGTVSLQPLN
tara:strand:+ start:316 stop:531 length:216 start_codon:yes stop_codon:yes gene_type:complete